MRRWRWWWRHRLRGCQVSVKVSGVAHHAAQVSVCSRCCSRARHAAGVTSGRGRSGGGASANRGNNPYPVTRALYNATARPAACPRPIPSASASLRSAVHASRLRVAMWPPAGAPAGAPAAAAAAAAAAPPPTPPRPPPPPAPPSPPRTTGDTNGAAEAAEAAPLRIGDAGATSSGWHVKYGWCSASAAVTRWLGSSVSMPCATCDCGWVRVGTCVGAR